MNDAPTRWTRLRDHLESALEYIHDYAVVLIDDRGRIASWNRGAERLLGHAASDVIGQPHALFFTPEDRDAGVPQSELVVARRTGQATDDRWHLRSDGTRFFGSGTVSVVRDQNDTLLGFIKIFRDLTAQRRALEQLSASEERYRLLVSSIKDYAIFMLDSDERVNAWTPAAERLMGYTSDEVLRRPCAMFFTPDDRATGQPQRMLQQAREHGRAEASGWRVRKDGRRFWAEDMATALYDASGGLIGYSKLMRDVTERREAEKERERLLREAVDANRLKDYFLGTMSHELRTPLNAILGWVQLLRLRNDVPAPVTEALDVIDRNARVQAGLIDDLLDASRMGSNDDSVALQGVSLGKTLSAAVDTVRPDALGKNVTLEVHHDLSPDDVMADDRRLRQILWNLLANAIKFTPSGGTVTVATGDVGDDIELRVVDTGAGIDPEFLPFVFDRFRQGNATDGHQRGGLGLGLTIVKHLVELHHGHIAVESDGPGHGTTVRVRIPSARRQAGRSDDSRRAAASDASAASHRMPERNYGEGAPAASPRPPD